MTDEDDDDDRPARAGNNLTDIFQLEDITKPEHLESFITAAMELPFKITLTPEIGLRDTSSVELQLTSIMSAGELEKVQSFAVKGLPKDTNTATTEALLKMAHQAVKLQDKIATRFGSDKFAASLLSKPWPEITAKREEDGALLAEISLQVRVRRRAFIELAGSTVIQDLLEAFILNVIKELVPDLDFTLVAVVINVSCQ